MMHSIRSVFTCAWTEAIYLWLFLKEDLWRVFDIYCNVWPSEETPVKRGYVYFGVGITASFLPGSKATIEIKFTYIGMNPSILNMVNSSLYNFNFPNWALPLFFVWAFFFWGGGTYIVYNWLMKIFQINKMNQWNVSVHLFASLPECPGVEETFVTSGARVHIWVRWYGSQLIFTLWSLPIHCRFRQHSLGRFKKPNSYQLM